MKMQKRFPTQTVFVVCKLSANIWIWCCWNGSLLFSLSLSGSFAILSLAVCFKNTILSKQSVIYKYISVFCSLLPFFDVEFSRFAIWWMIKSFMAALTYCCMVLCFYHIYLCPLHRTHSFIHAQTLFRYATFEQNASGLCQLLSIPI